MRTKTPAVIVAVIAVIGAVMGALLSLSSFRLQAPKAYKSPLPKADAPPPPIAYEPPAAKGHKPPPPEAYAPPLPQADEPPATKDHKPPPGHAPPPPKADESLAPKGEIRQIDAVDSILGKLEFGNIAFNAPKTMNLHATAVIQLLLGLEKPIDELKQMIEAAGEKEGERIHVSGRMEARLSGPNFAITAITPEIQAVSRNNVTEWKWEVKPSSAGDNYLHLTLSALLNVDGESTPREIRTFDKDIQVDVTWSQRVGSFFETNWQWLWAVILVPIAGWLWNKKKTT